MEGAVVQRFMFLVFKLHISPYNLIRITPGYRQRLILNATITNTHFDAQVNTL